MTKIHEGKTTWCSIAGIGLALCLSASPVFAQELEPVGTPAPAASPAAEPKPRCMVASDPNCYPQATPRPAPPGGGGFAPMPQSSGSINDGAKKADKTA